MTYNLNEAVAHLKRYGISRTNRFLVRVYLPNILETNQGFRDSFTKNAKDLVYLNERLTFSCEEAPFPGKSFSTIEQYVSNQPLRKLPYTEVFNDASFVFAVSRDFFERNIFDIWQNLIKDPITGQLNYYKEYVTDIEVIQLDINNNPIFGYKLMECYPIAINDMQASQESSNQYHRVGVSFAYHKFIALNYGDSSNTVFQSLTASEFNLLNIFDLL